MIWKLSAILSPEWLSSKAICGPEKNVFKKNQSG